MLEVLKDCPNPDFTLFIPFTREWILNAFFTNLDNSYLPDGKIEAVFFNDTDDQNIQSILRDYLITSPRFAGAKLYMSGNPAPSETSTLLRRERIVAMKNASKALIGNSRYTICLEDDTFLKNPLTLVKLVEQIEGQENIGFVGGVERGRWGFAIIGAWKMDNVKDPKKVWTLPYKADGIEEVDGSGWYCYVTPTNLYINADYRFEAECLGPDVCYVMDLRRQSYDCLVDWSLVCEHRTKTHILVPDEHCISVTWLKSESDKWVIQDITG